MALTEFQRTICRLIARQRIETGESYVAGGVALNTLTGATPLSRDIDLFHDTTEAVAASRCVLDARGGLFIGDVAHLRAALAAGTVRFHEGRIRGALPQVRPMAEY